MLWHCLRRGVIPQHSTYRSSLQTSKHIRLHRLPQVWRLRLVTEQFRHPIRSCARVGSKHIRAQVFDTPTAHHVSDGAQRHLLGLSVLNSALRLQNLADSFRDVDLGGFLGGGEVVSLEPAVRILIKKKRLEWTILLSPNLPLHHPPQQPQPASDTQS